MMIQRYFRTIFVVTTVALMMSTNARIQAANENDYSCANDVHSGMNSTERAQLKEIENITKEICDGLFPDVYEEAVGEFVDTGNVAPLKRIVCSDPKDFSRHTKNLRRKLTNVCSQYYGVLVFEFQKCTKRDQDPLYRMIEAASACGEVAKAVGDEHVDPLGCAWAGFIDVDTGNACNSTTLSHVALKIGQMTGKILGHHGETLTSVFSSASSSSAAQEYISCGSDDEGEGHRCCMAALIPDQHEYCIDWNSGVADRECLPKNCKGSSKSDHYTSQVACLNVFLDIDPDTSGACRVVQLEECQSLARKYPSTCNIEKSKEIADLSVDFVMIKCGDDCDGSDDAYSPDGSYFPRVLLSDPAHGIRKELYNFAARPETKFFYSASSELHETMQRALQHHREL
eukprot:g870.t1